MITRQNRLSRIALEEACEFLHHRFPFVGSVDLVIQVGANPRGADILDEEWDAAGLAEMPGLPAVDSVAGHRLQVRWGLVGERRVLVLDGRYHLYEGYGPLPCVLPVWAAAACGARNFMFVNMAGGIRPDLVPGSLMLLSDHINGLGVSPLAGHQHLLQEPYVDMTAVYDSELAAGFSAAADALGVRVRRGVYLANLGPQFETPAEIRLAASHGVDAVGMSTVLETTVAHALGGRVIGLSMITNPAAGTEPGALSHRANLATAEPAAAEVLGILRHWFGCGGAGL